MRARLAPYLCLWIVRRFLRKDLKGRFFCEISLASGILGYFLRILFKKLNDLICLRRINESRENLGTIVTTNNTSIVEYKGFTKEFIFIFYYRKIEILLKLQKKAAKIKIKSKIILIVLLNIFNF